MTLSEEENKKAKKDIKSALAKGDRTGLFKAGIENFFNIPAVYRVYGDFP